MITPSYALTATERVLPKLALDFTTASLDSRVTFTRSGNTATVINSSGLIVGINADLPRFDFNPVTLVCRGLLIEESRTNLLTYSSDYSNAVWTTNATINSSTELAPDGTNTAFLLNDTSAAAFQSASRQAVQTITANAAYAASVFFKKTSGVITNYPAIGIALTGVATRAAYAILNTTAGTAVFDSSSNINTQVITVVDYGNYWRLQVNFQDSASNTQCRVVLYPAISSNGTSISTSATGLATVWGAQLEAGAFATSYIPTVASQVTRNADVATMTGTNFSDWYNQSEGTFITQGIFLGTGASGATRVWQADAGGEGDRLTVITTSTSFRCISTVSSVSQADFSVSYGGASIQNSGFAYKTNDIQLSANATLGAGDNSCAIPTVSTFRIGASFSGVFGASLIRRISFFPLRLLNAELQAFTN